MIEQVITLYEINSYFEGYPTQDEVCNRFKINLDELIEMLPSINTALVKRGLDRVEVDVTKASPALRERSLDPYFVLAVGLVVDYNDKRSMKVKLEAAGLTSKRWNFLLTKPDHEAYFSQRVSQIFSTVGNQASLGLAKLVGGADLNAIKYYNELVGTYRPNQESLLNLTMIIGRLMEILVKYVEPKALEAIATEFDNVISPRNELLQ